MPDVNKLLERAIYEYEIEDDSLDLKTLGLPNVKLNDLVELLKKHILIITMCKVFEVEKARFSNKCIAEAFSRMRMIESWGTGIKRMFSSCREDGIKAPVLLKYRR